MQRKYDIDWLRTLIVLSIIPFHAMVIFNQDKDWEMYVKDTVNVPSFNFIDCIIGRFHMLTLFLLAGMAIYYSLRKRGAKPFLKQRFKKLFIPLVTASVLLNPVMTYITSVSQGHNESFAAHYIGFFTKSIGEFDGMNGGYTPAHLWFILYLFVYSLVFLPLFLWLVSPKAERLKDVLAGFFYKPMTLLLLCIPYCLSYLVDILDEKNPISYLYIVIVGCIFASDERYLKALNRDKWIYAAITLVSFVFYFAWHLPDSAGTALIFTRFFLVKFTKIIPAFALLGLFNCFINKNSRLLQYLSGASYTIYVVHLLVVTAIGFVVIRFSISPLAKLLIIITLSYAVCFALYEGLKRTRYIGTLFGTPTKTLQKNKSVL